MNHCTVCYPPSCVHPFPLNRVIKVAKEFVGRVSFAVSSKTEMSREMDALGLDSDADVQVGIYDSLGKYAMTDDFRYA